MISYSASRLIWAFLISVLVVSCSSYVSLAQSDARVLEQGKPIEREIAGGETHRYRITLVAGQFLSLVLDQRGIDVIATVFGPNGQQFPAMNIANSTQELRPILVLAEVTGDYRLEVRPRTQEAAGRYEVKIEELRGATPQDGVRIAAQKAFAEGCAEKSNLGAIEKFEEALALWRAVGDFRGQAYTLIRIGSLYYDLDYRQKALDYYAQGLPLIRGLGYRYVEALTLHNIGAIYSESGEHQKALDYYGEALALWLAVENRHLEPHTLTTIGRVYFRLGEHQKALEYYAQALPLRRVARDRLGEAITLNEIGAAYQTLGEYQKALDHYAQALPLVQAVRYRFGEATTLYYIGLVYAGLGEHQKALDHYTRALTLVRALVNLYTEAQILTDVGLTYYFSGEKQQALDYYNQALTLHRSVGNRSGEAKTLAAIARVELDSGNLQAASTKMNVAIGMIESLRTKVASQELRASYFASQQSYYGFYIDLLMRLHHSRPSAGYDATALEASERARARSLLETLAEASADIHQGVDSTLLEHERTLQQQLNAKEASRTQLLAGKHTEKQAAEAEKALTALLTQYQEVRSQIRTSSPRYAALTQPQPLSVSEIQQQVLDQDSLLLEYSLGKERSFLWAVTPTSIKSYVLPKQAEIETAARRVYELLTVRNHHPAGETAEQRAARVNEAEAEYAKAAAALSQMLLGSVGTQLGTKRLIIVSEGALQYVPFGALPAPGGDMTRGIQGKTETRGRGDMMSEKASHRRVAVSPGSLVSLVPLIAKHEIVTLPSASVLAVLRRELLGRTSAPKAMAVLADPVFRSDDPRIGVAAKRQSGDEASGSKALPRRNGAESQADVESSAKESGVMGFKRLRFSRQEAEAITAFAPGEKSLKAIDFAANRATATGVELSRYRVLHFATHGLLNSQHPELSGIVLSLVDERGQPQDGFLRLHEIYNLKLGADLVVLSACQTALGKEIKGEGLIGLTRGFMYAGAPRVVASLWNVDDRATAELMKRFYRAMFTEKMRPAAALRAAQTSLWREKGWAAPYYWAGFTLQGEWR
jgi:CHAT domain-containing protein